MFRHVPNKVSLPELECETKDTGRVYITPEGNIYPSITTVLGAKPKDGLDEWRKRVGSAEADKVLRQAGVRGTIIHQMAEDYLNNKPDWAQGAMPVNMFTFNSIKPILDRSVDNIWAQEVPLYSDRFKIAGRVDCIAEFDGVLSVIDFKTSRKEKKREWITDYFRQAAFYAAAFYERTGVAIKQSAIIMSVDDGNPLVFRQGTFEYLDGLVEARNYYKKVRGI